MKHNVYVSKDSSLGASALRIYNRCKDWFGPPADGEINNEYFITYPPGLYYARIMHQYSYQIDSRFTTNEQQVVYISYLTYERFAKPKNKKFLITFPVSSMVKDRLGIRIAHEEGFAKYADYMDNLAKTTTFMEGAFDDYIIKKRNKFKPMITEFNPNLEKDSKWIRYNEQSAKIGYEIERLVGWEKLCSIIRYGSIIEWIHSLPEDVQEEVSMYMDCESPKM